MKRKSYLLLCLITVFIQANQQKKMICHESRECYPEIFEATHVFQVVYEDQILPPGLHVRINFNTGVKEAKIMKEDEENENNVILIYQDGHIQPSNKINEKISFPHKIKPNSRISQEDHERFSTTLAFLASENYDISKKKLIDTLSTLEELSHELEFGVEICKSTIIIERLINLFKSSNSIHIKKLAITVLGSSLQNNPQALLHVSNLKLTKILLEKLQQERDDGVIMKILYTLSSIVKSSNGINEFHMSQGDKILHEIFKKTQNPALISKCASFIQDNYFQSENYDHDEFNLSSLSFSMFIDSSIKHWCEDFQIKFFKNYLNTDSKEKILSALSSLKKKEHFNLCKPVDGFLEFLNYEITTVYEKDHFYLILLESVKHLFEDFNIEKNV
ncbi:hypothetical protein PCANB_000090 [Pneumocystis canis]|nr:hypothetical protein PCANB_000090 [Pneumocystis canis]